jgi:hypothetical protein
VADFFSGSGSTVVVAEKNGRSWIGCDVSYRAVHTTMKRLMDLNKYNDFTVMRYNVEELEMETGGDATIDVSIFSTKKGFVVELKNFSPSRDACNDHEIKEKTTTWSDYIDYWAVDWDHRNGIFVNSWVSFRSHNDRVLELKTEPHSYPVSGRFELMIRIVDIFGQQHYLNRQVEV